MKHKKEKLRALLEEYITYSNSKEKIQLIGFLEGVIYSLKHEKKIP